MLDGAQELHDDDHVLSNRTRARHILVRSDMTQEGFVYDYIQEARDRARRRSGIRQKSSHPYPTNRMPYFFACLEDLLNHSPEES